MVQDITHRGSSALAIMMWALLIAGCTSESTGDASPATGRDVGPTADAGAPDLGGPDAGPQDTGPRDASASEDAEAPDLGGVGFPDADLPDADLSDAFLPDAGPPPPHRCEGLPDPHPEVQWRQTDRRRLVVDVFPGRQGLRGRRVVIWLPEAYDQQPEARFPVMYLHDGQNLFDPREAAFGVAWDFETTTTRLIAEGQIPPIILVAADNTVDRTVDYTPSVDPGRGEGGGLPLYTEWLVDDLKPWVDARLRTRCQPLYTGIGGSSLGGLASVWILKTAQDTFGRAMAMSSSLWWDGEAALSWAPDIAGPWAEGHRLWLDAGNREGEGFEDAEGDGLGSVARHSRALRDALIAEGLRFGVDLAYLETPLDPHNEGAWARRLPDALAFLWGEADPGAPTELTPRVYGPVAVGRRRAAAADARLPHAGAVTLPGQAVRWGVDDEALAEVSLEGDVTGLAAGVITLEASSVEDPEIRGALNVEIGADPEAEIAVRFEITVPEGTPAEDTIYLGGSLPALGSWQADGLALGLSEGGAPLWIGEAALPPGAFEFKVTRGSWETVEKGANGEEIANRQAVAAEGATVEGVVLRWADTL